MEDWHLKWEIALVNHSGERMLDSQTVEFDVVHLGMHGQLGPGSITRREGRVSSSFLCPKSQRNQFQGRGDPHGSLIPRSFGGIDEIEP